MMNDKLPADAAMAASLLNMKLRDRYDSLEDLCDDLDLDMAELIERMASAGFDYLPEVRQFR